MYVDIYNYNWTKTLGHQYSQVSAKQGRLVSVGIMRTHLPTLLINLHTPAIYSSANYFNVEKSVTSSQT